VLGADLHNSLLRPSLCARSCCTSLQHRTQVLFSPPPFLSASSCCTRVTDCAGLCCPEPPQPPESVTRPPPPRAHAAAATSRNSGGLARALLGCLAEEQGCLAEEEGGRRDLLVSWHGDAADASNEASSFSADDNFLVLALVDPLPPPPPRA
jgi:hypothetical protein